MKERKSGLSDQCQQMTVIKVIICYFRHQNAHKVLSNAGRWDLLISYWKSATSRSAPSQVLGQSLEAERFWWCGLPCSAMAECRLI